MHGVLPASAPAPRAQSLLRFFTCGSVDDGKSTLIGRLLYDTGSVFEDQLEALDRDSKKFGTQGSSLDFALLLDGLTAEREQGITIDVAYRYFSSKKRAFIVADTPGHEQYTRNMATGASTAELAIILVDARKGLLPQTRRHSYIVSMLGVRNIVLAINKMDLVDFDHSVYDRIVGEYRQMAATLGFTSIVPIPISARDGDNITTASPRSPWYRGPSLLAHLETVEPDTGPGAAGAFAMPVQWVNRPNLDFRGYAGTISTGTVARGDEIVVLPGARRSRVASIIGADGERDTAESGEAVTLTLTDEIDISRGDVLSAIPHQLRPRHGMNARLLWMIDEPLAPGREYIIQLATGSTNTRVAALRDQIDVESFAARPASSLAMNQIGHVTLACDKALVMADYRDNRDLGAFILIDRFTNQTAALGIIDLATFGEPGLDTHPQRNLADRLHAYVGEPGTAKRKAIIAEMATSIALAGILALIVWSLSGNTLIAFAVLLGDLLIRPTLRSLAIALTRRRPASRDDDINESGAGI